MYDNYNYPPGADTPSAPWNQCDPQEKECDVEFSICLFKNTTIYTTQYTEERWDDWEPDEEGGMYHTGGVDYDFSDCEFMKEFERQHLTPIQLIAKFEDMLKKLRDGEELKLRKDQIDYLLEECSGWEKLDGECTLDK